MTIQRMIELLQIEHECMLRGSHDDCDRNCADCELVQDDYDLHEMYTDVIALLKKQEPKPVIKDMYGNAYCPHCSTVSIVEMGLCKLRIGTRFCPYCGKKVKWDD